MTIPRYRLLTAMFIEPHYYPADTVIDYDGEPHAGMEPMNAEADAALKKYFKEKPEASIKPVEKLPLTVAVVVPPTAEAVPVAKPPASAAPPKPEPVPPKKEV